ncbi:MAG: hypothetical protein V4579_07745 [Pseudomonadota bacterium]
MHARSRIAVGWQYALADLSLILFMVCAAALAQRPPAAAHAPPLRMQATEASVLASPAAVWRAAPGGPSLGQWLAGQRLDPRQRLTVIARHGDGRAAAAFAGADRALRSVSGPPKETRIVIESGAADEVSATLTWDATAH